MGFKAKLNYEFSEVHERRFWNKLVDVLSEAFIDIDSDLYLLGNVVIEGQEPDAIIIKEDALIVVDFKDYSGELRVSQNAPWVISDTTINAGRKNPYLQLHDYKYALLDTLKKYLPDGYERWVNLGHINALVLFHRPIKYDTSNLQNDLSHSVSKWFNICDVDHLVQTLNEITSKQTSIKGERADQMLEALGIELDCADVVNEVIKESNEKKHDNVSKSASIEQQPNESFADYYHRIARESCEVKVLIVGQDPYKEHSNGVAFCMKSYYRLFDEDEITSGATVLNSLGLTKEKARSVNRKNPEALFESLLVNCGICFINVFHEVTEELSNIERSIAGEKARKVNLPIIQKAEKIILLGKTQTKEAFEEFYPNSKYDHVLIHPSMRAKNTNPSEWKETWESNLLESLTV